MLDKQIKNELLKKYEIKEERFFVSNLIDKIQKYESNNILIYTNFLDLNELKIAKYILDAFKIEYYLYEVNEFTEKKVIFLIPDYMKGKIDFSDYISCVKLIPKNGINLYHKDYMGSLYNIGIKSEMFGDIFVQNSIAYVYVIKTILEYISNNMQKVGRQTIEIKMVDIDSIECKNLRHSVEHSKIVTASMRVDSVLSEIYNLSRSEVTEKIQKGDLFINSKENFIKNTILSSGDIVSFKRCGKIKIGQVVNTTKTGKIVLDIEKYI
ncbi:MAG: YlmH/Sll1252 family protein [Clostridia bacterium]|nr:YlmH/Sll1252 family protein [Clostridia bacterium]